MLKEIHLIAGTRSEAVKLAPVVAAMRAAGKVEPIVVAGGQHPTMVHQALAAFGVVADETLHMDPAAGTQAELLTELVRRLDTLFERRTPAAVIVQGDTTTTLAGAMAAYWRRIPVIHLGAGLRSGDLETPFPEEANRRLIAQIATMHLAPTPLAAMNLFDEGVTPADVLLTGNTGIDATLTIAARKLPYIDGAVAAARSAARAAARTTAGQRRLLLVSAHRRESWGAPLDRILTAVRTLVHQYDDVDVILPSHPNPVVRAQVDAALEGVERVTITDPLADPDLSQLLSEAYLVLTDSGGLQEEAPSFGVPTLVLRDVTERIESLHAGCARLVGSDDELIVKEASALLDDPARRDAMTAGGNPYGDGLAAVRTAQAAAALLGLDELPEPMPAVDLVTPTFGG